MKCPGCGVEINENAKFCENCGARVRPESDKKNSKKRNNGKKSSAVVIVLLCILIGIAVFIAAVIAAYMFTDNQPSVLKESLDNHGKGAMTTAVPQTPQPEITAEPSPSPTVSATATPKTSLSPRVSDENIHVADPSYKVFTDAEMEFSCAYPTHFEKYNDNSNEGRYTLKNADGSAVLRICAEDNSIGITLEQSMSMFKAQIPGETEYSKSGSTYYAIRINQSGICRYRYLVSKNSNFYWFDFSYPEEYRDIYEKYIDHIYRSFEVK